MSDSPAAELPVESRGNHIPEAVRRAAARADELIRAQQEPDVDAETSPPVEESPPSDSAHDNRHDNKHDITAPSQDKASGSDAKAPDFEQRYRTLQGKYDAEVPRLRNEIAQLRQVMGEMHAQLQARPAPQPQQQSQPQHQDTETPPEIVEEYGADFAQVMRRMARLELAPEVQAELNNLRQEVSQLRGGQQMTEGQIARSRLEAGLSSDPEIGAHWAGLNHDPEFLGWLSNIDPFAGVPRHELLHDAARRGDVSRTAQFFRAYLHEHTASTQAVEPAPQTAARNGQAGRTSLESLAAPGRVRGSAQAGGASEKRMWSPADISKFYDDMRRGRYQGREADAMRIEADIVAASVENRIIQR